MNLSLRKVFHSVRVEKPVSLHNEFYEIYSITHLQSYMIINQFKSPGTETSKYSQTPL